MRALAAWKKSTRVRGAAPTMSDLAEATLAPSEAAAQLSADAPNASESSAAAQFPADAPNTAESSAAPPPKKRQRKAKPKKPPAPSQQPTFDVSGLEAPEVAALPAVREQVERLTELASRGGFRLCVWG